MKKERMYIKPFNKNFKIVIISFMLVGILSCIILSDISKKETISFMRSYSTVLLLIVLVYRFLLLFNKPYNNIVYNKDHSNFFEELLLFPCNICAFSMFLGTHFNSRPLINFSFFVSFSAAAAIFFPSPGCDEGSFLEMRIHCFYVTHFMIIFSPMFMLATNYYMPTYKDALNAILLYEGISFVIFFINLVLRKTGLNKKANYFFNMEPDDNPLLEVFYNLVPIPYLYTIIPACVFLSIFEIISYIVIRICG